MGRPATETALNIVIEVADGLSEAHSKEILPRDLEQANILITEDG